MTTAPGMLPGYTIYVQRIPEQVVPGKRLGRYVRRDSRSLRYLHAPGERVIAAQLWKRNIGILDQLDVGSCTGNAETGALGTDPLFGALPAGHAALDEAEALRLYSAAETIDGDGPYPPNDNGSTGTSVCQAALNAGLISGYTHCLDVTAMASGLQAGPVIIGINWYDSFDRPASDGTISISANASVRGGHEVLIRGVDPDLQVFRADNSWGTGWGDHGSFQFSYATMERLFSEDGDCNVPLPLSVPAPVPVPPVPAPVPPVPQPAPDALDLAFAAPSTLEWARARHVGATRKVASSLLTWAQGKGLAQ